MQLNAARSLYVDNPQSEQSTHRIEDSTSPKCEEGRRACGSATGHTRKDGLALSGSAVVA